MRRPRPTPSPTTASFWAATAEHRFVVQRCRACATAQFYARPTCTTCGSSDLADEEASGRGTLHTFTIARRATHPAFEGTEPAIIAIVELAEGPRVTTNIVDCDIDAVRIGMPVELTWDEPDEHGICLPLWRPARPDLT